MSRSVAGTETPAELTASRARILVDADESRRRVQREIHDGAQQRLVHALIVLKMARGALDDASPAAALVEEALTNVEQANRDLGAVVHALLPRSLTYGGLRTGLRSLVDDLPVPVGLTVHVPRLGPEVETTAYLVVAEALNVLVTEAQAHAQDGRIDLDVSLEHDRLTLDLRSRSTTVAGPGSPDGQTGVRDRVLAAGGSLAITSVAGDVTLLRVELPVDPAPAPVAPRPGDDGG